MNDLVSVFEQMEREKGINKNDLLIMIEAALSSAFRKHSGKKQNFEAHIDPETGQIVAFIKKTVVKDVENPSLQMNEKEAREYDPGAKVGDEVKIPVDTKDFGRIAAQTAKQVIIQKIRETERDNLLKEFKEKEGQAHNGIVQRFSREHAIIDLGKTEGILPSREQLPNQKLDIGARIKVYILKVEPSPRGPQIILSRTHPGLVKRLFELEVPEVYDKTVEIKHIVRDPGYRCKVAVVSHNEKVDPVGACVGIKGSRVQAIINELNGERMDIIPWSNTPESYVASSLSPAKISQIKIDKDKKSAYITVEDDKLSLAIGKSGQNVRLAARLSGWHIDIKSETQRRDAEKALLQNTLEQLMRLDGVGEKTANTLRAGGLGSIELIASAQPENLTHLSGIGQSLAKRIHSSALKLMNLKSSGSQASAEETSKKPKRARKTKE